MIIEGIHSDLSKSMYLYSDAPVIWTSTQALD